MASPTIDGSAVATIGSGTACSVSLTTSLTNDIICVAVTCNGGPVTSISGGGLTWARRARNLNGAINIELWWAQASAALSSTSITVNQTSSGFMSVSAFGVNGAARFDTNGAIPSLIGDGSGSATTARTSITTSQADDLLIGIYRFLSTSAPTNPGTGWTTVTSANFMLVEYKSVSALQTSTDVLLSTGFNGGNDNQNGGIGDALTADAALTGTWDSTEATDVFLAVSFPSGTWDSTEAPDVWASTGYPQMMAAWDSTEAKDVFAGTGTAPNATPVFVNAGARVHDNLNSSITAPLPTSRVVGNLLIAICTLGSDKTPISTPSGWTVLNAFNNNLIGTVFYRFVTGTETDPVFTFTGGSTSCTAKIWQYSGVVAFGAINIVPDAGNSSTFSNPGLTTTGHNSLVAVLWYGNNGTVTGTPSPFTSRSNETNYAMFDEAIATLGAHSDAIVSHALSGSMNSMSFEIELCSEIPPNFAAWASTEAKDVFAATGGILGGSWHSTEARDVFAATGYPQMMAAWDSTEPTDAMEFHGPIQGVWGSIENIDTFAATGSLIPPLALDGHATGGGGGTARTSATVTLTTTKVDDVVVVCVQTGGFFATGAVTSITDVAGLTWKRRNVRKSDGVRPYVETWWAHAPAILTGDVITVHTATTGAIDIIAFAVCGANYTTPWDTHTQAGWWVDNYGSGNVSVPVRTNAAHTFDFAFYASRDIDNDHTVSSPYTFLDFSSHNETNGFSFRSGLAYNIATTQMNNHVVFGQVGGGFNSRNVMTDAIVKYGETGTADAVRWYFDGYMPSGPAILVLSGSGVSVAGEVRTLEADQVVVAAVLIQSSTGTGEVSHISDASGGSSPWQRRSRVTNTLGTLALEIWYAWSTVPLNSALVTVTGSNVGPGDVMSFMAVGIHGPNIFQIWDGDGTLPAVAHHDSPPDTYQSVANFNTVSQNCLVLAFGANADSDPNGFGVEPFLRSENVPPNYGIAGPTPVRSGAPGANIATEFFFQHDQLAAQTAEFDTSPKSISWLMIADALPVGPPEPPIGVWASTEGVDVVNAAGYVPAFLTWDSVETPDHTTGAPAQAPYNSIGWLGWVPAFATWASTEAKDHLSGAAWVIGQPLTGVWHSVEDRDRHAFSNRSTVTGVWASTESTDRLASAAFLLPTAPPAPPTRKRRLFVIN